MPANAPNPSNTIIIVPARMASTRLPGKPLTDICGLPMIVQVMNRALEAKVGKVLIAAAQDEIAEAVRQAGGDVILTDANLPSGSDRVAQALAMRDIEGKYEYIVNLQGDLPTIDPKSIRASLATFLTHDADIATLVCQITDQSEVSNPNIVKAITSFAKGASTSVATDFMREIPADLPPPYWHHIGVYAYRRASLKKFVELPVSEGERARSLEQMRALDNDMKIAVCRVDTVPFGVDTPHDLERARLILADATIANRSQE